MSTVPFRCPYCGANELHPVGRKLPEMCGQCRFDQETGKVCEAAGAGKPARKEGASNGSRPPLPPKRETVNPLPEGFVNELPPSDGSSLKSYVQRLKWKQQRNAGVTGLLLATVLVLCWINWPQIQNAAVQGFGVGRLQVGVNPQLANAVGLNADRNAVSKWLGENWDSTDWEEVKWWPAVNLEKRKRAKLADIKRFIDQNSKWESDLTEQLDALDKLPPVRGGHDEARRIRDQVEQFQRQTSQLQRDRQKAESLPNKVCMIRIRTKNVFSRLNTLVFEILPDGGAKRIADPPNGQNDDEFWDSITAF